ncbi:uncharacterized protein B0H18DRAFT_984192 [Fomitopsis serialis]|uniref:uncharacterized protein n=1 Tax=Fomitopsis serialis TaxID=139415 RepID=UPI0020082646|nr:uncharacterized protein B0H18DRAFT_984192 [Neoantrodia serialis]KAH9933521.1 hypothetical protein B0H18DRAFT_984192 [Neoantrodia serialis]
MYPGVRRVPRVGSALGTYPVSSGQSTGDSLHGQRRPRTPPQPVPSGSRLPAWQAHILQHVRPTSIEAEWVAPAPPVGPAATIHTPPSAARHHVYGGAAYESWNPSLPDTYEEPAYAAPSQQQPSAYAASGSTSALAGALQEVPSRTPASSQSNAGPFVPLQYPAAPYTSGIAHRDPRTMRHPTRTSQSQLQRHHPYAHPAPARSERLDRASFDPFMSLPPTYMPNPPPSITQTWQQAQPNVDMGYSEYHSERIPNMQGDLPYADATYPSYSMSPFSSATSGTYGENSISEYAAVLPGPLHMNDVINPYVPVPDLNHAHNIPGYAMAQGSLPAPGTIDATVMPWDETAHVPSYDAFSSSLDTYTFEDFGACC